MDQFILFGDSITQQAFTAEGIPFGARLSDAYIRKLDIVNRGLSGYNTTQALQILPRIMPKPSQARVRVMWIFFGANDARLPNTPGGPQQHVPLEKFKDNLRAIALHPCVLAHEGIELILVTPPPVDERMLEKADEEKYGQRMLRRQAQVTGEFAMLVLFDIRLMSQAFKTAVDLFSSNIRASSNGLKQGAPSTCPQYLERDECPSNGWKFRPHLAPEDRQREELLYPRLEEEYDA